MTRDPGASGALEALAWRGWVVLRDRMRPGRGGGTLDHVLVGPGGVFVTSRKRWPGPVAVVDGELHLAGRPRPSDINEVSEAAAEVLVLVPDVPVHPVLCLERHQPVTGWVRNVMLCASSNAEEVLTVRPTVLGPEQVRQVADVLSARLRPVSPPASTETAPRVATPWPVRVLLQAVTMAVAALLVIVVLQTGVVSQISTVVGDFIAEVATVDDKPKRKPVQDQSPEQTTPRQAPGERVGERSGHGAAKRAEKSQRQERGRRDKKQGQDSRQQGAGKSEGKRTDQGERGRGAGDRGQGSSRRAGR